MRGVDLEHARGLGRLRGVGAGGQDLLHLERDGTLGGHARRRVVGRREVRRDGDLGHGVAERLLHRAKEALVGLRRLVGGLLLLLARKVEVAARDVLELERAVLALGLGAVGLSLLGSLAGSVVCVDLGHVLGREVAHGLEAELVDVVGAQKHVEALGEHGLDHRHLCQAIAIVAGGVVDGLLALGHGLRVLLQGDELLVLGAPEEQQAGELVLLHAIAGVDAVLEAAAEVAEELLVRLTVGVAHGLELGGDLLLDAALHGGELAVLLQRLAADVQCDVGRVDDAAHEVVVVGKKVRALLHDQDVGAVELEALLVIAAIEVEGGLAGDKEERVVLERALGVETEGARRVLPVVEGRLVELVVLLGRDVASALLPDGGHGVQGLELLVVLPLRLVVVAGVGGLLLLAGLGDHHLDRVAHVVAVALDQVLQGVLGEVLVVAGLVGVVLEGKDDVGAAGRAVRRVVGGDGLDGVALDAVGGPAQALVGAEGARDHADRLGHHEGGVEAHAEAADDVDGVALLVGVGLLELLGAGVGDGAEVLLELVGGHADAVVRDSEGAGVLVVGERDGEVLLVDFGGGVGQALEVELVDGVGGVGDELAQEDLAVGVDGVDHEVEELFALCLEFAHGSRPFVERVQQNSLYPTKATDILMRSENLSSSRLDLWLERRAPKGRRPGQARATSR